MAITLPLGIRLAAGLLGTAIDRATSLPAELPSMAVTFAGQALRTSMRVRQELAELATRGDELLAPLVNRSQENPAWATFDEDEDDAPTVPRSRGSVAPDTFAPATTAPDTVTSPAVSSPTMTSDTLVADSVPGVGGATFGAAHVVDEPVVTLLDGTPLVPLPEPGSTGPGETVPTAAGFVVGPAATPEALVGGAPGDVVITELPPIGSSAAPAVANARRTSTTRARGRATIKSDHKLTIAELKERTQQMSVAEVRALLAQEEAGPNRAAYLTLLGNRLMTLQHEDR